MHDQDVIFRGMKYFFEPIERQQKLRQILQSWLGTPYRHWAGIKGLGADCIHFVARVLEEMGLGPFSIPRYPKDWHLNRSDELLLEGILRHLRVEDVGFESPENGDIILFRFGKAASHSAIYCDGRIYQAVTDIGVERTDWHDRMWHKRKAYGFRILDE